MRAIVRGEEGIIGYAGDLLIIRVHDVDLTVVGCQVAPVMNGKVLGIGQGEDDVGLIYAPGADVTAGVLVFPLAVRQLPDRSACLLVLKDRSLTAASFRDAHSCPPC